MINKILINKILISIHRYLFNYSYIFENIFNIHFSHKGIIIFYHDYNFHKSFSLY